MMFAFILFIQACEFNGLSFKATYLPHHVAMRFGYDQDIPQDICGYKLVKSVKVFVPSRIFKPWVSKRYFDWWNKVDNEDFRSDRETTNCEEKKTGKLGIDFNKIPPKLTDIKHLVVDVYFCSS